VIDFQRTSQFVDLLDFGTKKMPCPFIDAKHVPAMESMDQKLKEQGERIVMLHKVGAECGNCHQIKRYLAHYLENGVIKHRCCDCVGERESWTPERHQAAHFSAAFSNMFLGWPDDHVFGEEEEEDSDDEEMPELEEVAPEPAPESEPTNDQL